MDRLNKILYGQGGPLMPFAPPFLRADDQWLSHTAAIKTCSATIRSSIRKSELDP